MMLLVIIMMINVLEISMIRKNNFCLSCYLEKIITALAILKPRRLPFSSIRWIPIFFSAFPTSKRTWSCCKFYFRFNEILIRTWSYFKDKIHCKQRLSARFYAVVAKHYLLPLDRKSYQRARFGASLIALFLR